MPIQAGIPETPPEDSILHREGWGGASHNLPSLVNSSRLRSGQEGHVLSFRRPCLQNFKYWLKAVLRNYSRLGGLRTPLRSIQVTSKALSGKGTDSKSAQPVLTPHLKPNQRQLPVRCQHHFPKARRNAYTKHPSQNLKTEHHLNNKIFVLYWFCFLERMYFLIVTNIYILIDYIFMSNINISLSFFHFTGKSKAKQEPI